MRVAGRSLSYGDLASAASSLGSGLPLGETVAVWATRSVETCVAVVAAILSGSVLVPLDPDLGPMGASHVLSEVAPRLLLAPPGATIPDPLRALPRIDVEVEGVRRPRREPREPEDPKAPAFLFMTSGTTGPPKGAIIPRRAIASNLDSLASVWGWTAADVLVHGLPLFHVHGLVLGVLGSLRVGGRVRHVGRFESRAISAELAAGGTMAFAVPTMYRDLADAAEADPAVARALSSARLLVSGSAPLPPRDHRRLEAATGRPVLERYGLTETLMNCAEPISAPARPGSVGPSLPGVEVRLVDERGEAIRRGADDPGELEVRGPNLFLGYEGRPNAWDAVTSGGWFRTGDVATRSPDGWYRILGRRDTDLIKTGGYRVGAGEVEASLLEHPAVAEAAVTGEVDERLGQRIVAWVVLRRDATARPDDLIRHVADSLAPHKRPRSVRFVDALPRNAMGKVTKQALGSRSASYRSK